MAPGLNFQASSHSGWLATLYFCFDACCGTFDTLQKLQMNLATINWLIVAGKFTKFHFIGTVSLKSSESAQNAIVYLRPFCFFLLRCAIRCMRCCRMVAERPLLEFFNVCKNFFKVLVKLRLSHNFVRDFAVNFFKVIFNEILIGKILKNYFWWAF